MSEIVYEMRDLLFPQVSGVEVVAVRTTGTAVRVEARCTTTGGACPSCDGWSERVHSSYLRFPADLPVAGRRAEMVLQVRRFLCGSPACGRRTFVEQIPGLTRRHGRVTERLRQMLSTIGLALAGRAGARLAEQTGIMTSRSTLLRRVMDLPDPVHAEPTAVGVDDFALRRRANSSMPSTCGVGRAGSVMRIRQFSTVAQDSTWCSTPNRRAPADPASATATASTTFCRAGVRRW